MENAASGFCNFAPRCFPLTLLQSEHENCSEIFVEIISQTIEIRKIRKNKIHKNFVLYNFPNYAHSAELPVVLETLLACYILASLAMCFIHDPVIWPSVSNLVSFLSSKDTSCKIFPPNFVVLVLYSLCHYSQVNWMLIVQCPSA